MNTRCISIQSKCIAQRSTSHHTAPTKHSRIFQLVSFFSFFLLFEYEKWAKIAIVVNRTKVYTTNKVVWPLPLRNRPNKINSSTYNIYPLTSTLSVIQFVVMTINACSKNPSATVEQFCISFFFLISFRCNHWDFFTNGQSIKSSVNIVFRSLLHFCTQTHTEHWKWKWKWKGKKNFVEVLNVFHFVFAFNAVRPQLGCVLAALSAYIFYFFVHLVSFGNVDVRDSCNNVN